MEPVTRRLTYKPITPIRGASTLTYEFKVDENDQLILGSMTRVEDDIAKPTLSGESGKAVPTFSKKASQSILARQLRFMSEAVRKQAAKKASETVDLDIPYETYYTFDKEYDPEGNPIRPGLHLYPKRPLDDHEKTFLEESKAWKQTGPHEWVQKTSKQPDVAGSAGELSGSKPPTPSAKKDKVYLHEPHQNSQPKDQKMEIIKALEEAFMESQKEYEPDELKSVFAEGGCLHPQYQSPKFAQPGKPTMEEIRETLMVMAQREKARRAVSKQATTKNKTKEKWMECQKKAGESCNCPTVELADHSEANVCDIWARRGGFAETESEPAEATKPRPVQGVFGMLPADFGKRPPPIPTEMGMFGPRHLYQGFETISKTECVCQSLYDQWGRPGATTSRTGSAPRHFQIESFLACKDHGVKEEGVRYLISESFWGLGQVVFHQDGDKEVKKDVKRKANEDAEWVDVKKPTAEGKDYIGGGAWRKVGGDLL